MAGKTNPFPSSEYALLGLLIPGPCHGYEIHKQLQDPSGIGMIWGVKMSNLYAQLEKLEKKGLIRGKIQAGDHRPARMEFTLTSEGQQAFEVWLHKLIEHPRDFRQEFMVRLFFLTRYHSDEIPGIVKDQLSLCEKWSQKILEADIAPSRDGSFPNLVYHFRLSQVQSMIDWLKWILEHTTEITSNRGEE